MKILPEKCDRKIDNLGRVTIPKSIRNRLGFDIGEKVEFFTMYDDEDNVCIVLKKMTEDE